MVVNLVLETDEARHAADAALSGDRRLLLVPRLDGRYATVGTVAVVEDAGTLAGGARALVVRGVERARIAAGVTGTGAALWVRAEPVADVAPSERAVELAREYRAAVDALLDERGARRLAEHLPPATDPGAVADTAIYWPELPTEDKVALLEELDVEARLERALGFVRELLAEASLRAKIRDDVTSGLEKGQREHLLRQQLQAIRKELGEDEGDVLGDYRRRLDELDPPEAVRTAVERELGRLERTGEQSPEHGWIRTWLDTVLDLPWATRTDDRLDLVAAREVLDADHAGLDDVKDRVIEHLAVRKLRRERGLDVTDADTGGRRGGGAVLVLVGPPGVGKTSLGESVARALGRRFSRVALGGARDEAEIRGHRRTYVGAQPGRLVRALHDAGSMNPVILLDEVDKLGADWRGDPSSALLEVLDPAQNHTFRDHYLEIELDLSDVLFLATANVADTIPGPLLDRMEVVRLDGYSESEKVAIARRHLLPRLLRSTGLAEDEVEVTDAGLAEVVDGYTREAGVRDLERQLAKLLRKAATRIAGGGGGDDAGAPAGGLVVDEGDVRTWLGRRRFDGEPPQRTGLPGVATGLAVTGAGGDVLVVEASAMPGEPGLTLTGQLGDVMKESAEIARSYVRSHAAALGLDDEATRRALHLHVPAGAVPKDGPSAGVTMVTALVSLLTGRPVRATVGMTGEVTLQGQVLPIGGVRQKLLAAHRAGLREVVLPARNEPDLEDVPEEVRSELRITLASDVTEVLAVALAAAPAAA
jgi:ATP-dependent Lon protease